MTEETLFELASQLPAGERVAFLDRECTDPALRARVEALLAADVASDSPLDLPPAGVTCTLGAPAATGSFRPAPSTGAEGATIAGRYKLQQQIGEGGMGTVWMADQTEPVKRKVAIKLIRVERGQSKTILARFEAERQAIALMDHPHIAKLLDAGTTDAGQPYFVMELVKGIPLSDFCDQHRLTVPERLKLFVQICSAVQHAHQKGIIHRDLKPSNILVESHDGKPVPKVIDFGLAKATTGLQLTEQSLFTAFGSVMGTPLYMAPEQANFNAVDVDTRADVYALGVILYELLTGTTPLTKETMKKAALDEMLRLIREQEAPTPSSRLSSADSTPSVAANRQIEPTKLGRFVRGELDWIVAKALSKERDRRYETANDFAKDVERFLNQEPVTAGPPSTRYRLRKFIQRNRGHVIAAGLVLLALVAGVVGTTWQAIRAERARADEASQRLLAEAKEREANEERSKAEGEKKRAIAFRNKALDALRATTGDDVEKLIGEKKELTANEKAYLDVIARRWQTFAKQEGTDEQSRAIAAEGRFRVAVLWHKLGRRDEARPEYEQAVSLQEKLSADFPAVPDYRRDLAQSHHNLASLLDDLGKRAKAQEHYLSAIEIQEKLAADVPAAAVYRSNLAFSRSNLGGLLDVQGHLPEAEIQFQQAIAVQKKLAAELPAISKYRRDLAASQNNLGNVLAGMKKWGPAEKQFREAIAIQEKLVADDPTSPEYSGSLAISLYNLGFNFRELGMWPQALDVFNQALAINNNLAADFPIVPEHRSRLSRCHNNLGLALRAMGARQEAKEHYTKALAIQEKLAADFPAVVEYRRDLGGSYCNFGILLRDEGQADDSLGWFDKAVTILAPAHRAEPRDDSTKQFLRNSHANRAIAHDQLRKHTEAVKDWDQALELSSSHAKLRLRASRATSRVKAGMVAEAVAEVAELTKSPNWTATQWNDFAHVYAVASVKFADKKAEYADRAMELLTKAVEAGYKNHAHMKRDTALDPLREREDFKKLLAELEKKFPPSREVAPMPKEKK